MFLVWGICSPERERYARESPWSQPVNSTYGPLSAVKFDHRFTQINDETRIPQTSVQLELELE
jgi:hypothetical protein